VTANAIDPPSTSPPARGITSALSSLETAGKTLAALSADRSTSTIS
jgi:hypothetical protein